MTSVGDLDEQWDHWVRENLARGVPGEDLVSAMARAGFDSADALAALVRRSSTSPQVAIGGAGVFPASTDDEYVPTLLLTLTDPFLCLFADVLSPELCVELVSVSSSRMEASTTIDANSGEATRHEGRKADVAMFQVCETPLIELVDRCASVLMDRPVEFGEGLQVVRYGPGGEYRPHFDYFILNEDGNLPHLDHGGQRVATLIIYLNDVEEGGETVFPELALAVSPRRGHACYFAYATESGIPDARTIHGGAPVQRGEKWIATKWMRANRLH